MTPRAVVLFTAVSLLALGQAPSSGIDRRSLDESIRPQDDLFAYVNARWIAATAMPADRVSYGTFLELTEKTEADLRVLVEEAAAGRHGSAAARQVGDLYASITDEARLEALGDTPIRPELNRIDAIATTSQLAAEAGYLSSIAAGAPFGGTVSADARDPDARVAQIAQGGTLLPDRDYYFNPDAASVSLRAQYVAYLAEIFTLVKRRDPEGDARAVLAFETELARAQWSTADSRDPVKTDNRFTIAELRTAMPGFDWREWAKPQGLERAGILILLQPSFFKRFAELVPATPLETLKAWLASRYITARAPYLSHGFDMARFEFFGRVLTGQELPITRWKRGVSLVSGYLGDAVGRLYVERHFPAASKARVERIVANMREAFRRAIVESDWMTASATRAALDKLTRLAIRVGYPEAWHDYGDLVVKRDDPFGNIQRANQFQNAYRMRRLAGLTDPGEWLMTPQTVNAYYAPASNEIVLPAAVLQPPLFDPQADDAANYGAIGAILGHEMVHAFDERGRGSDGGGAVRDWWTAQDVTAFRGRVAPLLAQYDAYVPLPGLHVSGPLTQSENIGDLAGLSIAYRAYELSLGSRPSVTLEGFTGEQRFFLSWARAWRGTERDEYLRQMLFSRQYAPWPYRANGPVSHLQGFYDAFGVKPGDRLYRPPAERVRIW
jgi:predicted metalloendopeptidase